MTRSTESPWARIVRSRRALGLRRTVLLNRWGIALAGLALGDPSAACEQVRLAAAEIDASVAGLEDVAGPDAREVWAGLFDVGVLAALRLRNRDAIKRCNADLEAARVSVAAVIARTQREARIAADIVYPEPPVLKDVEAQVPEGDVLVEYAIGCGRAVALVVTHEGSRLVGLGSASTLRLACEALRPERLESQSGKTVTRLRELAIAPLQLPRGTKSILISPHDALSYVPFALLVPGVDVGYLPSAASFVLLRRTVTERGEAVLALGDPAYRGLRSGGHRGGRLSGRPLPRLPATRKEAEAVGDRVLLGREACVARFFGVLAERSRWRAVHVACHGIVGAARAVLAVEGR